MKKTIFFATGLCLAFGCTEPALQKQSDTPTEFIAGACNIGLYGQDNFIVITQQGEKFSYSHHDGRRGQITETGHVQCGEKAIRVDGDILLSQDIIVTDTVFDANGVKLVGQLIQPAGVNAKTPLVVLAHGSEETGWVGVVGYPYQFAGRGVSAFVYDKRGTGLSEGEYSQNFPQLADDLVAASAEAKRLAGTHGRFGLYGFSQGGWIAPLAAEQAKADFIGIGYGLVVDILEEDAAQVELELREAGYGDDVVAKAKEITDITARLAVSGYTDGLEDLDAIRAKYNEEAWYPLVRGGFTWVLLSMTTDELRDNGIPMFDRLNIDWSIKPMQVLRNVDVPQLWVLAEKDREAPIEKTIERLAELRETGKEITIYQFPNTDHGMWEYNQAEDNSRTYTRVTDQYYELLADWAKNGLKERYADSVQK